MTQAPVGARPLPALTLSRGRVTAPEWSRRLLDVKAWPVAEFNAYLRQLMDAAGLENYAELSRLSGVSQNQFSNWRRGLAQPSRDNLRKIAPALRLESPVMLFIAAGHDDHEELGLDERPDFAVLPQPFQELREVYERLSASGQGDLVLDAIRLVLPALRARAQEIEGFHAPRTNVRRPRSA